MIIRKLSLKNWMRIRHLELHFEPGINLVFGPNETGKSSIMRAIRYALTADAGSARAEYKEVVPWGTEVQAKVDLHFSTGGGDNYQVFKTFPRGTAEFYKEAVLIAEGDKAVREKLFRALGIREETVQLFDLLFIAQGEALQLLQKKKINLDDNTRAYIEEIIRETALQSLRELENSLGEERDRVFTNPTMKKFKTGKNAPPYFELLDKERALTTRISELSEKENECSRALDEMETLDARIRQDNEKKLRLEASLVELKTKEGELAKLEKELAAFKGETDEYRRLLDIEANLEQLSGELPGLYALAHRVTVVLNDDMQKLETKRQEKVKYRDVLRKKKLAGEEFTGWEQEFRKLETKQKEIAQIEHDIRRQETELPALFALHKMELTANVEGTAKRITERRELEKNLAAVDKQLQECRAVAPAILDDCKQLSLEIQSLENRIADARGALDVSFTVTPENENSPETALAFNLKLDDQEWASYQVTSPQEYQDFQRLSFRYPGLLGIEVAASPAEINLPALEAELKEKKAKIQEQLKAFAAADIKSLEKLAGDYEKLLNEKKELARRLADSPEETGLLKEKAGFEAELVGLEQDLFQYLGKQGAAEAPGVSIPAELHELSPQQVRDRLVQARAAVDLHRSRLAALLAGQEIAAQEKAFKAAQEEYEQRRLRQQQMEPQDKKTVTQDDLDEAAKAVNDLEKTIEQKKKDKEMLEKIEAWPGPGVSTSENSNSGNIQAGKPSTGIELGSPAPRPQELREDIQEKRNRSRDLHKQLQELLKERKASELKIAYLEKKDGLDNLGKKVKAMPPLDIATDESARAAIETIEQEMKNLNNSIAEDRAHKSRLEGEVKSFAGVIEEKNDQTYERERTITAIREQQVDIAALKLLFHLLQQEKEKAGKEVFKPLEKRVFERFKELTAGRYGVTIRDDLGIAISALSTGREPQPDIIDGLSFGTKEQLSFLLRLAIAVELSRKEQQVMILDDSFVNTDDYRLPLLMNMIRENAQRVQFLIFTCNPGAYQLFQGEMHGLSLLAMEKLEGTLAYNI